MQKADIKKVLILGGSNHMVKIVENAKKLGLYTIVSDHAVGAPAKKCADSSHDISPADVLSLMEVGEAEQLDGIYATLNDVTAWNALALCKRLNVPFYAAKEQLEGSLHKEKFLEYCKTFDVAVIDESVFTDTIVEFPVPLKSYAAKKRTYAAI